MSLGVKSGYRLCKRALLIAVMLGVIIFGGLHLRLAHSPISLSFVVSPIEEAVNANLNGMRFDIGDAVLQRSDDGFGLEFRLAAVQLLDDDGDAIAESPFASGEFSFGALFAGRIAPSRIDLIGPKLYAQLSEERGLSLSFSDPGTNKGDLAVRPQGTGPRGGVAGTPPRLDAENIPQDIDAEQYEGLIRQARGRAVNLTKALTQLFAQSRAGESAYLNEFGIRDALVFFDRDGDISRWRVPVVNVDLSHGNARSEVNGTATISSPNETFEIIFGAQQDRGTGGISLSLALNDIIPRAFDKDFPALRMPKMWDMPVSVRADMRLGENGDILAGDVRGEMKAGKLYAPWDDKHPAFVDHGEIHLTYSREEGLINLVGSELRWGESRIRLSGFMKRQPQTGRWGFRFAADELLLGAQQFGLPNIPLDQMIAEGFYDPAPGQLELDRFFVQAADAYIALAGRVVHGEQSPAIRVAGQVSAMPVAFFKLIWPKFVAHDAREWVGERIPSGRIAGGTLNVDIPKNVLAGLEEGGSVPQEAVDFQLDLRDLQMHYIPGLPPMAIPQGTMRVAGQRFFFNAPAGVVTAPSGEPVNFSDGQLIIGDLRPFIPEGEIHFKSESGAAAALSLLDHPKLGYVSELDMPIPQIEAAASSAFSMSMKLVKDLKFEHIRMNGRTTLQGIRTSNLPGGLGVHGGGLVFDVSSTGIDAEGELKMNGIPVLVGWRYLFRTPNDQQPPLRLRTVLDENARNELGLAAPGVLTGPAASEVAVQFVDDAPPNLSVRVNLNEASINVKPVGWQKPRGAPASLAFEMKPSDDGSLELRDINLEGDDFRVQGAVKLDAAKKPVAFNLPVVSLTRKTQMRMRGELNPDNIWKIHVRGESFDGQKLFRTLLSSGTVPVKEIRPDGNAPGVDVDAEIGTVLGFFNTSLDSVKFTGSRRGPRLEALDLHGQLNGERPFAARLEKDANGRRILSAQATDAGAAFRLVGFYPSARGGEATLNVNLDAGEGQQIAGRLFAQNFVIVNDEVVEEVLSRPQAAAARPQNQQVLQFDRMQVPFTVGGGQFLVRDALINGPLLGATLRGSIDFGNENINLSGTYVPLYGINGALGFLPILGDLLVGRDGEGLFGITFAVKGKTTKPDVLVNPMSVVAPGFLRQIFEFNNQPARQPPTTPPRPAQQGDDARSSSLPATTQ